MYRPVLWLWFFVLLFNTLPANAQIQAGPLRIMGSIGIGAEAYSTTGVSRRAPMRGQVFANAGFDLWGLTSGIDVVFDTDQQRLQQSANQLAFSTGWRWGRIQAGDVSPALSPYALTGVSVRGGAFELTPGPLRLAVAGGQARQALGGSTQAALEASPYNRTVLGARLGLGGVDKTHFHIVGAFARDAISSAPQSEIRPAENLVLAPEFGLSLFGGAFFFRSTVAASLYTRDLRAEVLDVDVPLLTLRVGTSVDFAGEAETRITTGRGGLTLGYNRVQPGYEALTAPGIRPDEQTFRGAVQLRLPAQISLDLSGSRAQDNLLDQRDATMTRDQFGVNAQWRVTRMLALNGGMQQIMTRSDVEVGAQDAVMRELNQLARVFTFAPTLMFAAPQKPVQTISLSTAYAMSDDQSPAVVQGLRPGIRTDNVTGALAYSLTFPAGLSLNASGTALQAESPQSRTRAFGASTGVGKSFLNRRLQTNLNAGFNRSEAQPLAAGVPAFTTTQFSVTFSSSMRFPAGDQVRLSVRGMANQGTTSFREGQATLRYTRSF